MTLTRHRYAGPMDSTYVVTVETTGVIDSDDFNTKKVLKGLKKVGLTDSLVRDDGTAILYFEWKPEDDGAGAETWNAGKARVEEVRSSVVGVGLPIVATRVGVHAPGQH